MNMFRIYKEQKQMIRDWLFAIGDYMDESQIKTIIKDEMKEFGIYDGEDIMWISPDRKYKFNIDREYNSLWNTSFGNEYFINIKIFDAITNVPITIFTCSTASCVDALYRMSVFPDEMYQSYDSDTMQIGVTPNSETIFLYIENIAGVDRITGDVELGFYNTGKDVMVEIRQYNSVFENLVTLVSMDLSLEELSDFCFHIFFESLIDLELPRYMEEELSTIEEFMIFEGRNPSISKRVYDRSQITDNHIWPQDINQYISTDTIKNNAKSIKNKNTISFYKGGKKL